jgi:hypothetical protein
VGDFSYTFSLEESEKGKSLSYKYRLALGKAVLLGKNKESIPGK